MRSQFFYFLPFIRLGLSDVIRHKSRSLLTALGVVFGVGSVVAMLAISEGASQQAVEAIKKLGCENILVASVRPTDEGGGMAKQSALAIYGLLYEDNERIRETIPNVQLTVPARMSQKLVRLGERQEELRVVETTPGWFGVVQRPVLVGRVMAQADYEKSANVCILTESGARKLLANTEVTGKLLRIASAIFEVVGVVQSDSGSPNAPDSDVDIYIPLSAGNKIFGDAQLQPTGGRGGLTGEKVELSQIIVKMTDIELVEAGSQAIESMLMRYHHKKDYKISIPLALLREAERTKRMYNIVFGAIAGISLLVGGIGIMNIMMATVTERTKEIGIRRAIGARRSWIIMQFLINTCVLSVGGGLLGLGVGVILPAIVTATTGMPTCITFFSLVLAFGISALIGIVFGLYPAIRAAHLDPIEALRHE